MYFDTCRSMRDLAADDLFPQANLARLNLPYPEAVFDINYFRQNPQPCTYPQNV